MFLKFNYGSFIGLSLAVLVVFVFTAVDANASWQGPSADPPNNNISAPLNVSTLFNGDVTGTYDSLRIRIANCSSSQVLVWNGNSVECSDINSQIGLLNVLTADADAHTYIGGVIIGTSSETWLNVGGALTAGWLHSTQPGNNSLAGDLGIGTEDPNSQLHIYNTDRNAEIDLQSIGGADNHWAIYHKADTDDLRFWNQDTGDLVILGSDKSLGINGSLLLSDFIPEVKTSKLYTSAGVLYWNGARIGMGVYVGKSTAVRNGDAEGYANANDLCNATFSGSRVCFNFEMVNSITSGVVALKNETGVAWVQTGAVGNNFGAANDCNAFQSSNSSDYGTIWAFEVGDWGSGFVSQCNFQYNFACCK